jgi:hypothetical protein
MLNRILKKSKQMNKIIFLIILMLPYVPGTRAQQETKIPEYKVPAAYNFDYKVVYETKNEEDKTPVTVNYYFTKNGDYMSMISAENQKDKDQDFMVSTKDGLMITFGEESIPKDPEKNRKVIKVIDMHSMMKGSEEAMSALAKSLPEKDKAGIDKTKHDELDNFVKTGKTKQVFGYTAEEYSKHITKNEKGKVHSGTISVWYARVDFDPEMMFSFGMGNLHSVQSQSKMNQSHPNNMLGLALTQKNYLLIEMDFSEDGGKNGSGMKVVSIEKTNFSKSTEGYIIKNYSGMSMAQMMQKQSEEQ